MLRYASHNPMPYASADSPGGVGASQEGVNAPNTTTTMRRSEWNSFGYCRGSHTDCEEHEKNCHAAQSHMHGVATERASAGCQYITLVHGANSQSQEEP